MNFFQENFSISYLTKMMKKIGMKFMKLVALFILASSGVAFTLGAEPLDQEVVAKSLGLVAPVSGGFVVRAKVERTGTRLVGGIATPHTVEVAKDSQATVPVFFKVGLVEDEGERKVENEKAISALAEVMQKYPIAKFLLEGHTCDLGSKEMNTKLSWQRAEAVKAKLIAKGIDATRLLTLGFGEAEGPVHFDEKEKDPATEEARRNYRRVVVRVLAR